MLEKYKRQKDDIDKIILTQKLALFQLKLNLLKNTAKSSSERLLKLVEKTMVK